MSILVHGSAVGLRLQVPGPGYRLGAFWMFRRFAVNCLTSKPKIPRAFGRTMNIISRMAITVTACLSKLFSDVRGGHFPGGGVLAEGVIAGVAV